MGQVTRKATLEDVANGIILELRDRFPGAEYLINGQTYGEEDLYIDIYVDEDELLALDRLANEVTFRCWEETGYSILPMVAPATYDRHFVCLNGFFNWCIRWEELFGGKAGKLWPRISESL